MANFISPHPSRPSMFTPFVSCTLVMFFGMLLPIAEAQLAVQSPMEQRVLFEAVRSKKTRIQGGDFDDKTDRITFKLKFNNSDTKTAFNDLQGEFYIFAESITVRKAYQLLGIEKFPLSLAPRGLQEITSAEVSTQFDTTDARFGSKYESWALVVRDSTGAIVMKKASTPRWLAVAEKLKDVAPKKYYSPELQIVNVRL